MKKILLAFVLVVTILAAIFLAAGAPFFLKYVKGKIETAVQAELDAPVSIGSLQGNLFYAARLTDLKIADCIEIRELRLSYNVFKLLSKKIDIRSLDIDGLRVDLDKMDLPKKNAHTGKDGRTPGKIDLSIRQASVTDCALLGLLNKKKIIIAVNLAGKLMDQEISINSLSITTASSSLRVTGRVRLTDEPMVDLQYQVNAILDEFGLDSTSGRITGLGEIKGSFKTPRITLKSRIELDYHDFQTAGTVRGSWRLPFLDSLDLTMRLQTRMPGLPGPLRINDRYWLVVRTENGRMNAAVTSTSGRDTFELKGFLAGTVNRPEINGRVAGVIEHGGIVAGAGGVVSYQKDTISFRDFELTGNGFSARINGCLSLERALTAKADIALTGRDLAFINNFTAVPRFAGGRASAALHVAGRLEDPHVSGEISLSGLTINDEMIDKARLIIEMSGGIAYLRSCAISCPKGSLAIDGLYDVNNNRFSAHVLSSGLSMPAEGSFCGMPVPASGDVVFDMNFEGTAHDPVGEGNITIRKIVHDDLEFDNYQLLFALNGSVLDLSLTDGDDRLLFSGACELHDPFPFSASLTLRHFDLKEYTRQEQAYATARMSARGELARPELIAANIQVDTLDLTAAGSLVHSTEPAVIDVKNGVADITRLLLSVKDHIVSIKGQVPLDLKNGDFGLVCQASQIDVAAVAAMSAGAPPMTGSMDLNLEIKGRLAAPLISGRINLENISCRAPDLLVDSANGLITLKDRHFVVEFFNGRLNNGTFNVKGSAHMSANGQGFVLDTVALDAAFARVRLRSKEFGKGMLSGVMLVSSKFDSVKISGELTVDEATYDVPFDLQTIIKLLTRVNRPPPEQSRILKQIYCDIGISSPRGVRIANNVAKVSANIDMQLKGPLARLNAYGTITTFDQGTVTYLGKKFVITGAAIAFDDPYQINPVLNLYGMHSISSRDGDYDIFMHLSGTVEKWHLDLTSSPALPEPDIISLLLIGRRRPGTELIAEAADIDLKGAAREYALSMIKGRLERTAEKGLGLEKITITGGLLEPRRWKIGLEKKIGPRFTVIYGAGIENWEVMRIGANYDLTDNLSIFTLHDQENLNSSVDLDFHFTIK
jgi:hypothetical protein